MQLKENFLNNTVGQQFAEITKKNTSIAKISLDGNPINKKFLQVIKDNLKHNREMCKRNLAP
jgi:hypothetical protein